MFTGRVIRICNFADAKERMNDAVEILKAEGFIVSKGESDRYMISSAEKSLEEIDDAVYKILRPRFIGFQNKDSFRELEAV